MARATVSAKGWVVIPKELREKYGLTPGRSVEVIDYGGEIAIVPVPDDPVGALYGMFSHLKGSLTQELLEERRREREREDRRAAK